MKPYPAYKPTGLAWLPEVPREWNCRKFKYLFSERSEKGFPNEPLLAATQNHGVILKTEYENRTVTAEKGLETLKLVKVGDFVISLRSFEGGIELSYRQGIISPAYTIIFSNGELTNGYFKWLGKSAVFIQLLKTCVTGIREGQNIDYGRLRVSGVPIPPPAEQEAIVAYLDEKTAKIDRLIELKEREIKLLNEKKQAVISKVVTRGLDPNAELVDGDVPGWPRIPKHWQRKSLKTVLDTPMCDGPHTTPSFAKEGVPFVSAEGAHDGRIFVKDCRGLISRELHEEYCKRLKPQKGDIFIVKSGSTTGKTVMVDVDDEFSVWSPLALVRVGEKIDARYLFNFLTSVYFQREVQDNWSFGTQPNIGMGVLKNLYVLVPPREEQVGIVRYVDALSAKTDKAIAAVTRQIGLLKEYRTRLISDAVTGRIDLRKL